MKRLKGIGSVRGAVRNCSNLKLTSLDKDSKNQSKKILSEINSKLLSGVSVCNSECASVDLKVEVEGVQKLISTYNKALGKLVRSASSCVRKNNRAQSLGNGTKAYEKVDKQFKALSKIQTQYDVCRE